MTPWREGRSRAAAPAVGKALEAGIVVLFVALLAATLYGGVVPDARTAAGEAVGDRALQHAAAQVEAAVPPAPVAAAAASNDTVLAERRVRLPDTIRGRDYRVEASGARLALVHEHRRVGGRTPLVLPDRVRTVRGNWTDGGGVVRVRAHPDGGLVVELAEGAA
ncbi:DUF7266 family protein [Halobacterium yunchengense]|uniref:DUF7266 family protein n=1 Tax=Halobacterium yunchengense TaxID=3108497 RepID=UPI00300A1E91